MTTRVAKYVSLFISLWQILPESYFYSLPVGGRQIGGTWIDAFGIKAAANQADIVTMLMRARTKRSIELLANSSSERHYASTDAEKLLPFTPPQGLSQEEKSLHVASRAMLEQLLYMPQKGQREKVEEAFRWFNAS